jgi:hypothetical protein
MIKLHASYGLKVPADQEYSSQSFHATAEVEVADSLASNPDALRGALHKLWGELRQAVNDELQGRTSRNTRPANNGQHNRQYDNGHKGNGSNHSDHPPATRKQVGYLLSLMRRKRNFSAEQTRDWLQRERGMVLDRLSKTDAAQLIDELNHNGSPA